MSSLHFEKKLLAYANSWARQRSPMKTLPKTPEKLVVLHEKRNWKLVNFEHKSSNWKTKYAAGSGTLFGSAIVWSERFQQSDASFLD